MQDIPIKSPGDKYFSTECNNMAGEEENLIKDTGISLSGADLFQMSKSVSNYVGSGDFYNDTGVVNAYVLNALSTKKAPTAYVIGLRVRFIPSNTNTGPSTANLASLGVKAITDSLGQPLNGGELPAGEEVKLSYDGTSLRLMSSSVTSSLVNIVPNIKGLTLANNSTDPNKDIDVGPGSFLEQSGSLVFKNFSTITKQIDANWAPGTNAGGFPSGLTLTADTWYRVGAIAKPDGTVDFGYDTAANFSNLLADATGYIFYRTIEFIYVNSSLNIFPFYNVGDTMYWNGDISPYKITTIGATFANVTLFVPPQIVEAFILTTVQLNAGPAAACGIVLKSNINSGIAIEILATEPPGSGNPASFTTNHIRMLTDASSQIQHRYAQSFPNTYVLEIYGWRNLDRG